MYYFFFFQAEDGIRDWSVTGVQTCALPIAAKFNRATVCKTNGGSGDLLSVPCSLVARGLESNASVIRTASGSPEALGRSFKELFCFPRPSASPHSSYQSNPS